MGTVHKLLQFSLGQELGIEVVRIFGSLDTGINQIQTIGSLEENYLSLSARSWHRLRKCVSDSLFFT